MKKILVLCLMIVSAAAFADSPITSTGFAAAYEGESVIALADNEGGILVPEAMEFLISDSPVELKMALINKLSWDFDGKKNAELFWSFLQSKKGYADTGDFMENGAADELLCMAYITAMDDYFDVSPALPYAMAALGKNTASYTFHIITAIIRAQAAMDHDWCAVYRLTDNVRKNANLSMDMRPDAIAIIFEYMDLYKDSCD